MDNTNNNPIFTVSVDLTKLDTVLRTLQSEQLATTKHVEHLEKQLKNQGDAMEKQKGDMYIELFGSK